MNSALANVQQNIPQRWLVVWVMALFFSVGAVGVAEWHWRSLEYHPHIRDSAQLWSIQRDRVDGANRVPLALLGASHIQYAIDMKLLKQLLPEYQPVMLAYNGHYPLATLHDLARDKAFDGVVLCDIDARGLSSYYDDAQQPFVDYYHHQWSPSWHFHRLLLTAWQRNAIVGSERFSIVSRLLRWIGNGPPPWRSPVRFHADRSGGIDFSRVDKAALTRGFVEGLQQDLRKHPAIPADRWLADLQRVREWCDAIRQRGGKVIFFRTPTSGALQADENAAFPRSRYWDKLAEATRSPTFYATDAAYFKSLNLHDGSHVDYHDRPAYTRALVAALTERGLLQR